MVLASGLQRVRGPGEGHPADPRMHVRVGDAGTCVLARAVAGYRLR